MPSSRIYPSRPIVAVSAMIKNEKNEILVVRRAKPPGKGLWSLPGGAVELGEKVTDALKREIWEECNISIKIEKLLGAFDRIFRDDKQQVQFHYVVLNYLCHTSDELVQPGSDVDRFAWIDQKTESQYSFTEGVKNLLCKQFS